MGKVLTFPGGKVLETDVEPPELSCLDCVHLYMGNGGLYCSYFKEEFDDDTWAVDCEAYDAGG